MRVYLLMALRIMLLDMLKLCRLSKRRHIPIQIPQPLMQSWVSAPDIADIALEVLNVDRVESDDRGIQANISLSDILTEVVRFFGRGS